MPVNRNATTVKSAVRFIIAGNKKSPLGTAKNRKAIGKVMTDAIFQPTTAGMQSAIIVTKLSWVTALIATKSPNSQKREKININSNAIREGCGSLSIQKGRARHMSHKDMKGTIKPCAYVSETVHSLTI